MQNVEIKSVELVLSNLFEQVGIVATLLSGQKFIHPFRPSGHGATERAQKLANMASAKGEINLVLWNEYQDDPSLEERLGAFGTEWDAEQRERDEYYGR